MRPYLRDDERELETGAVGRLAADLLLDRLSEARGEAEHQQDLVRILRGRAESGEEYCTIFREVCAEKDAEVARLRAALEELRDRLIFDVDDMWTSDIVAFVAKALETP